ncbi:MAG: carboxypeptidase-like regulatory domain-containing protein [Planctomycetota bacterium]
MNRNLLLAVVAIAVASLAVWLVTRPGGADIDAVPFDTGELSTGDRPSSAPSGTEPPSAADPADNMPERIEELDSSSRAGAEKGARASLGGRILDEDGRALSGVTVALLAAAGGFIGVRQPLGPELLTSGTGAFLFQDLPAGTNVALEIRARGKALRTCGPYGLICGETTQAGDLRLEPGLELSGVVRSGADLTPIQGATVTLVPYNSQPGVMRSAQSSPLAATTDGRGQYRIEGAGFAIFRVFAEADGFVPSEVQRSFLASRHLSQIELSLSLSPANGQVQGEVFDSRGQPVPGAMVLAQSVPAGPASHQVSAVTDGSGAFLLEGLGPGSYQVTATKERHSQPDVILAGAGQEPIRLTLVQNGSVRGQVADSVGGSPGDLSVEVLELDAAGGPGRLLVRARVEGDRFFADDLPPGRYQLSLTCAEACPTLLEPFELQPGEELELNGLRLAPGGTVIGRALDDEEQPLPGVSVLLMPHDLDPDQERTEFLMVSPLYGKRAVSDSDGRFRLSHLPEGIYKLRLVSDQGAALADDVRVKQGNVTDLGALGVGVGGQLTGLALDQSGNPLARARILVRSRETLIRASTWTDGKGGFSVPALPEGTYRVSICLPDGVDPYLFEHEGLVEIQKKQASSITVRIRPR